MVKADCQIIFVIIHTVADYYHDYILHSHCNRYLLYMCSPCTHTVVHGGLTEDMYCVYKGRCSSPYRLLISTQLPESLVEDSDLL